MRARARTRVRMPVRLWRSRRWWTKRPRMGPTTTKRQRGNHETNADLAEPACGRCGRHVRCLCRTSGRRRPWRGQAARRRCWTGRRMSRPLYYGGAPPPPAGYAPVARRTQEMLCWRAAGDRGSPRHGRLKPVGTGRATERADVKRVCKSYRESWAQRWGEVPRYGVDERVRVEGESESESMI